MMRSMHFSPEFLMMMSVLLPPSSLPPSPQPLIRPPRASSVRQSLSLQTKGFLLYTVVSSPLLPLFISMFVVSILVCLSLLPYRGRFRTASHAHSVLVINYFWSCPALATVHSKLTSKNWRFISGCVITVLCPEVIYIGSSPVPFQCGHTVLNMVRFTSVCMCFSSLLILF